MLFAMDTLIVAAAAISLPSIAYWSSYRGAVNRSQRRLYRQAYAVGVVLAGLVSLIAMASAHGAVPLWVAAAVVAAWCIFLPTGLSWLRRELEVRAREPYADLYR